MKTKYSISIALAHRISESTKSFSAREVQKITSGLLMAAAVALISLSVPVTAFSQMQAMPMNAHGEAHGHMMDMIHMDKMGDMLDMCVEHADKMGLTEDQINKMKPVHREMQKKHARYKADLKIAEIELSEIMDVKDFDMEKGSVAVRKAAEIKTVYLLEMLTAMKEVRTMLTDEQFNKMKKMAHMKQGEKKLPKKIIKGNRTH